MSKTMNEQIVRDILNAAEYKKMKLDDITPAPYNPRVDLKPEDAEYKAIKRSIQDHGFIQPIVYNEQTGNAVGGNQRLKILKELGVTEAVCAIIRVPLVREMEISVALNKHDNLWDREKLRDVMLQLKEAKYDVLKTAFDQLEFEQLTQELGSNISSFFEEEQQEDQKPKKAHRYKCPYCGEIFEK